MNVNSDLESVNRTIDLKIYIIVFFISKYMNANVLSFLDIPIKLLSSTPAGQHCDNLRGATKWVGFEWTVVMVIPDYVKSLAGIVCVCVCVCVCAPTRSALARCGYNRWID